MIKQYWVKHYETVFVGCDLLNVASSLGFILINENTNSSTGKALDKINGYISAKHHWDSTTYF